MNFPAEVVWSYAVAVDRINEGYFKEDHWEHDEASDKMVQTKQANKRIMKTWLAKLARDPEALAEQMTPEDVEHGRVLRHYFNGYLLKEVSGKINDFEKTVLRIAQMDEFSNRKLLEFAIISCLPASYRREQSRKEFNDALWHSEPIEGEVGETIVGDMIVVKSYYNNDYNKYRITGRFGESFVEFWYKEGFEIDAAVKIKGKIKRHRPNSSTQLNYVKEIKN